MNWSKIRWNICTISEGTWFTWQVYSSVEVQLLQSRCDLQTLDMILCTLVQVKLFHILQYKCNRLDVKWIWPLACLSLFSVMNWTRVSTLIRKLLLPNLVFPNKKTDGRWELNSCPHIFTARIMTSRLHCFVGGLSLKKADVYYLETVFFSKILEKLVT